MAATPQIKFHNWRSSVEDLAISEIVVRDDHPCRAAQDHLRELGAELVISGQTEALLVTHDNVLLDGRLRLEAARLVGAKSLWVQRVDARDHEALKGFLFAEHTRVPPSWVNRLWRLLHAEREYVRAHPESLPVTVRGGPGRGKTTASDAVVSFADLIARSGGPKARTIRSHMQIARALVPEAFARLEQHCDRNDLTGLRHLSKLTPEQQVMAIDRALKDGMRIRLAAEQVMSRPLVVTGIDKRAVLHVGDFAAAAKKVASGSVDLVLTDVPWEQQHVKRFPAIATVIANRLRPGGTALVMVGQSPRAYNALSDALRSVLSSEWITAYMQAELTVPTQSHDVHRMCGWYPVLVFRRPGRPRIRNDVRDLVYETQRVREDVLHAQSKDVDAFEQLIRMYSRPDDLVYDPFVGSGTSAVAAHRMGRRFVGSDLNPSNVANVRQRLSRHQWSIDADRKDEPDVEAVDVDWAQSLLASE